MYSIAIDGPSGAGKSTVAKALAKKTGFVYLDTGAMYRTLALYMKYKGVSWQSPTDIARNLDGFSCEIKYSEGEQRIYLDGKDVSSLIRTPEISEGASIVSAVPEARKKLVALQQEIGARQSIIMDGRDIGTKVLPNATLKIFLTASPEERARRRQLELLAKDPLIKYEDVLNDMKERDHRDSTRAASPLVKADDAVLIDATDLSFDDEISYILGLIYERMPEVKDGILAL